VKDPTNITLSSDCIAISFTAAQNHVHILYVQSNDQVDVNLAILLALEPLYVVKFHHTTMLQSD
jgi:hypothetical protein